MTGVQTCALPICFPVTIASNEDLDLDEEESEDLLESMEKELTRRRFGPPVRLEVDKVIARELLEELMDELEIEPKDVIKYDSRWT